MKQEAATLLRNACLRPHDSMGESVELKDGSRDAPLRGDQYLA